ncbi:mitochondrial thiamine pyrophosphate carrier-like [Aricia agestis]|uniref:mitochondrial thiamine pyrophosphate carrier-like n=1 Tax=Aricia agestis TaxID=91739 RepID=UPI001C20AAB4|nr:mitochondrial thiamine pyrophosphate carrier-like [Aricia agestis]
MVQIDKNESNISVYQSAFAGGVSGSVTRALAQPLDILKIRFQLQVEPIQSGSKYSSIFQAFTSIIKEEGTTTLWSGHIPAQLLSISYGLVQFSVYEKLTQTCQQVDREFYNTHKHWINFSNGGIAASIATIVSFPFDTVRTRLIAEQKTKKAYKGFLNAVAVMMKNEGALAFFKGIIPTIAQIGPHAGVQFAVYKVLTENLLNDISFFQRFNSNQESTLTANLLAGGIAGIVSKTVIYPFDVVKKRLQIQGFQQHRYFFGKQMYCTGVMSCVKLIVTEEGFLALYKGYCPSMLKAMFVSALHFAIYDEIKHIILRL